MATRDRVRAVAAIESFLRALGHEPAEEDDLRETGHRVAEAWLDDLLEGESVDAEGLLHAESFACGPEAGSAVVLRDLEVATMCPHHLMPAQGTALIAYIPGERLAGLGTLTRVLDAYSRRLTLQERIGQQFVEAIMRGLGARGAACVLRLRHACLSARGSRRNALVETVSTAGSLAPGGEMHGLLQSWLRGDLERSPGGLSWWSGRGGPGVRLGAPPTVVAPSPPHVVPQRPPTVVTPSPPPRRPPPPPAAAM